MNRVGWAKDEDADQIKALLAADGLFLEGGASGCISFAYT